MQRYKNEFKTPQSVIDQARKQSVSWSFTNNSGNMQVGRVKTKAQAGSCSNFNSKGWQTNSIQKTNKQNDNGSFGAGEGPTSLSSDSHKTNFKQWKICRIYSLLLNLSITRYTYVLSTVWNIKFSSRNHSYLKTNNKICMHASKL